MGNDICEREGVTLVKGRGKEMENTSFVRCTHSNTDIYTDLLIKSMLLCVHLKDEVFSISLPLRGKCYRLGRGKFPLPSL